MKRTRAATNQAKKTENPDTPGPKKTKPEGPSRPAPEVPRGTLPSQPVEVNSSPDASELVRRFLNTREHSPTEEDPSEDTFPPREVPQRSPIHPPTQRVPLNPPPTDQTQNSPTSPAYTPTPHERTPSSAGSTNGYYSLLSVQIDTLTQRVYEMDQGIASRLCHLDQLSLNITTNVDRLRATVNLQENQGAQLLREMADLRSEQNRQRDEMRTIRIEMRSIRTELQEIRDRIR